MKNSGTQLSICAKSGEFIPPTGFAAFATAPEGQPTYRLCSVRAARTWVERTGSPRKSYHLLVFWAGPHRGKPVTKQCFSHWVVEVIALAYTSSRGLQPPEGLRAHLACSGCIIGPVQRHFPSGNGPLTFISFLDVRCFCFMCDVWGFLFFCPLNDLDSGFIHWLVDTW